MSPLPAPLAGDHDVQRNFRDLDQRIEQLITYVRSGTGDAKNLSSSAGLAAHEADTSTHGSADLSQAALKNVANTFTADQTIHAPVPGGAVITLLSDDGLVGLKQDSDIENRLQLEIDGDIKAGDGTTDPTVAGFRSLNSIQTQDALLDAIAALSMIDNRIIVGTGADTVELWTVTDFVKTLLDDADAATARGTLGAQADLGADPSPPVDRQVFTASGTWTRPTAPSGYGAYTEVLVELIGGGAGGGSGRRGAAGTARTGGGGGGGGSYSRRVMPIAACDPTEAVTVGAGGNGGAAVTANDTNGAGGTDGTNSQFGTGATDTRANGAINGSGGANGGGGGGGAGRTPRSQVVGQTGGNGGSPSAATSPTSAVGFARGGGGGGGITSADVVGDGAAGGNQNINNAAAGSAGAGGAGGGNGSTETLNGIGSGGGGGGGGASITAAAGTGGNGGAYGSGGGGGGASLNGNNSGAGGNGAAGIVVVTTR